MNEQRLMIPLKSAQNGQCGLAYVTQRGQNAAVKLSLKNGVSFNQGYDEVFLVTQTGTVAYSPSTNVSAPVCGVIVMRDGACICQGITRDAKVDLEKEKAKLRMMHMRTTAPRTMQARSAPEPDAATKGPTREQPAPTACTQKAPPPVPEQEQTAAAQAPDVCHPNVTSSAPTCTAVPDAPIPSCAPSIAPAPAQPSPPVSVARDVPPVNANQRSALYGQSEPCTHSPGVLEENRPQANFPVPGNSAALRSILERAQKVFSPLSEDDYFAPCHFVDAANQPAVHTAAQYTASTPIREQAVKPLDQQQNSIPIDNPFANSFPNSKWRKVFQPQGQGWYLEGEMQRGREVILITAVPGEYRPVPPRHLQGFSRYIKSREGGFWVRCARRRPQ